MAVEWLVTLVATNAFGFLVKTILNEDFAKDLAKDYAKDFFKGRFNKVGTAIFQKEPIQKAIAKALKEFLQLLEEELKFRKLADEDIKKFAKPLKTFVYHKSVKEILGKAFDDECDALDYKILENTWNSLGLPAMPARFDWQLVTNNYLRKAQQILFESDELRSILDSQNLDSIEQHTKELAGIAPDFNLRQYQEAIRECYVNLKLESLDTSGYAYNELRLWRMFIPQNVREVHQVLPQVHELPKEYLRQLRESNQLEAEIVLEDLERYKRAYFEQPISSVMDIVNDPQTSKYIVILGDPGSGKSTLLQYLALDWVEKTLDKLDKKGFDLPPIPLLIELRTYMRSRNEKCNSFLEFFHQSSGVIARLNQHQLDEQLKAGKVLVMFDGLDEVFDPGKREDVITEIHRFTNEYPNVQVIVTSRVIGYKAQRLRDAEFRHFMLQDLEHEQIQNFINCWHDLTFNNEVDKPREVARVMIHQLRSRNFILCFVGADYYAFVHRTFLEYFCAWEFVWQFKEAQTLSLEQLKAEVFGQHWQDESWHEVLRLIAGMIEPRFVGGILEDLMAQKGEGEKFINLFLAANCLADTRNRSVITSTANELLKLLKDLTKYDLSYYYERYRYEKGTKLVQEIRTQAVTAVATTWKDDLKTKSWLKDRATADNHWNVRIAAVQELARGFKDDADTLGILKNRATADNSRYVRIAAVQELARGFKDDAETLGFLKNRATADDDGDVRRAAVQELARGFKNDADTLGFLKDRTTADDHRNVRSTAVQELARCFKDDAEMFEVFYNCAVNDPFKREEDWQDNPRQTALEIIIKQYPNHPQTLPLLRDRAENDPDEELREFAKEKLAELDR